MSKQNGDGLGALTGAQLEAMLKGYADSRRDPLLKIIIKEDLCIHLQKNGMIQCCITTVEKVV